MVVSRYFEPVTRRYRKSITIVRNIVAEDERRAQVDQPISLTTLEAHTQQFAEPSRILDKLRELSGAELPELDDINSTSMDRIELEEQLGSTVCSPLGDTVQPQESFVNAREEFIKYVCYPLH